MKKMPVLKIKMNAKDNSASMTPQIKYRNKYTFIHTHIYTYIYTAKFYYANINM